MKRYGMLIKIKPESLDRYKELHKTAWPGVIEQIRLCNIRNYSIYYRNGWLFSYYEFIGENYDEDMKRMASHALTQEWWELCKPCQEPLEDVAPNEWWAAMEEIFHVD